MTKSRETLLREAIRSALTAMDLDATALARQLNRGKDYIRDFLDGRKDSLPFEALSRIEVLAGLEPSSLVSILHPSETAILAAKERRGDKSAVIDQFYGPGKIPHLKYHDALDGTMDAGNFAVSEFTDPGFLPYYARPYAITVEGDSMEPVYEPGDVIFVSDELGLRKHTDHVFFKGGKEGTRAEAVAEKLAIRRLVGFDQEFWLVRSFNPLSDAKLKRSEWREAHRIVGRMLRP